MHRNMLSIFDQSRDCKPFGMNGTWGRNRGRRRREPGEVRKRSQSIFYSLRKFKVIDELKQESYIVKYILKKSS